MSNRLSDEQSLVVKFWWQIARCQKLVHYVQEKGHRKEPAHPTGRQITGDNEFTIVAGRNHEGWAHAKSPGIIVASLSSSSSSWSSSLSSSSSSSSSSCHHLHDLHQYLQAGPTRSILTLACCHWKTPSFKYSLQMELQILFIIFKYHIPRLNYTKLLESCFLTTNQVSTYAISIYCL